MINKVGKATRFGKDLHWWYNTGKKVYEKGKDIYDQYFYNDDPPPQWVKKLYDFGMNAVTMDFYVC